MRKRIRTKDNVTIVKLIDNKGRVFIGKAKVHPDDLDFASDRTGEIIAENRARIQRHQKMAKERQNEIDALKKQIAILESSRDYHLAEIPERVQFMEAYLDRKSDFYKKVRKVRQNPNGLGDIIASLEGTFDEYNEKVLGIKPDADQEVVDFD